MHRSSNESDESTKPPKAFAHLQAVIDKLDRDRRREQTHIQSKFDIDDPLGSFLSGYSTRNASNKSQFIENTPQSPGTFRELELQLYPSNPTVIPGRRVGPLNRFYIPPGSKWDGVDRSNGFEQKYFKARADRQAKAASEYTRYSEDL